MSDQTAPPRPEAPDPGFSRAYLGYVIFIFFLANLFVTMDRVLPAILNVPLREEFNLNDSQLGMLSLGYSLFYAGFGLVLGRLADVGARNTMLAWTLGLAGLATCLAGLAQNFVQLFLARIFAGIGEAGSVPSKYSLVGDMFQPARRASALALISAGLGVGSIVGLVLGGVLVDAIGWRWTLVCFAIPGILLAILVMLTIREATRGRFETAAPDRSARPPDLRASLRSLAGNRTFVFIVIAYACMTFSIYGIGNWLPSFLVRTHGMSLTQVGVTYGAITGLAMLAGMALGATLATRLLAHERRWEMWLPGAANLLVAGCYACLFLAKDFATALLFAGLCNFLHGLTIGPASAAIQSVVSARMRGVAVSITMFVAALIGGGLGPWAIGALSEALAPGRGEGALQAALQFAPWVLALSGALYLAGGGRFNADRVD